MVNNQDRRARFLLYAPMMAMAAPYVFALFSSIPGGHARKRIRSRQNRVDVQRADFRKQRVAILKRCGKVQAAP
jgi:hypothetical protein